jgi:hypothetical protein
VPEDLRGNRQIEGDDTGQRQRNDPVHATPVGHDLSVRATSDTEVLSITRRAGTRLGLEERSLKIIMLTAVVMFVVGAIAEARDTHTVWGQGSMFWMLLGFAAVALEFAVPRYAGRFYRR